MKLWDKGKDINDKIIAFTSGNDRVLDEFIAAYDVIASIAHVKMLCSAELITKEDEKALVNELLNIFTLINEEKFNIDEGMEDVHSQVEKMLTEKLGDSGKKVHTARSRNDQILVDLKLFYRAQIIDITFIIESLIKLYINISEETKDIIIPGYTHLQAAMPSSFGMWFAAYAEALADDLHVLKGVFSFVNQNPLGSAAGYGSSFPINREMTTELLEFNSMHVNSVNAQMARGKTEKIFLSGISNVAATLSKMSMDMVLFMSQNFDFLTLNENLTTGSSIMPHKKNPDVLELIRAKCNRIQSLEFEILTVTNNLPSGYHRDFQLLKEIVFPAITELKDCLKMMHYVCENLEFKKNVVKKEIYKYLSSVDAINEKVKKGIPFREAYAQVASEIDKGRFRQDISPDHSHTGSIGNLANDKILSKLERNMVGFEREKYRNFEDRFIEKSKKELS